MEHETAKEPVGASTNRVYHQFTTSGCWPIPSSFLTIFSCCIGFPAHFACGRSEFLEKGNTLINVYQTPTIENHKLINWEFVSFIDPFSSHCCVVVFGLCVICVVYVRD